MICFFLTILSFYLMYNSYNLIRGCKKVSLFWLIGSIRPFSLNCSNIPQRESAMIKPMLLDQVCWMIFTISMMLYGIPQLLIAILIDAYICIVLYSLWSKFKEEEKNRLPLTTANTAQQLNPIDNVVNRGEPFESSFVNAAAGPGFQLPYAPQPNAPPQYTYKS